MALPRKLSPERSWYSFFVPFDFCVKKLSHTSFTTRIVNVDRSTVEVSSQEERRWRHASEKGAAEVAGCVYAECSLQKVGKKQIMIVFPFLTSDVHLLCIAKPALHSCACLFLVRISMWKSKPEVTYESLSLVCWTLHLSALLQPCHATRITMLLDWRNWPRNSFWTFFAEVILRTRLR